MPIKKIKPYPLSLSNHQIASELPLYFLSLVGLVLPYPPQHLKLYSQTRRYLSFLYMKMRNKGKIYPSPSSSPSPPSYSPNRDALSVLKLLPAAILALASVLSIEDKEVLAYMITRSTNPSSVIEEKKKNSKKSNTHKPPVFDCECFDCYTSYWFRWDSSPNRELIHQAIEAFEEHLNNGEHSKKNKNKKREKTCRRANEKVASVSDTPVPERENDLPEIEESIAQIIPSNEVSSLEIAEMASGNEEDGIVMAEDNFPEEMAASPEMAVVVSGSTVNNHKGLARKVLPDLLGLFNSRLWSLWNPNM
ncbi:unnamed protein product [Ilex paraguariensis]|uniref:Uncharacterized protein n=1 Tax=Ilex paraguariensis TaxID=185542 RepID=A0ABC8RMU9_9AQUA